MKDFNLVKARTYRELEEKIIALIKQAQELGLTTRTVYDGDDDDESGWVAFVRIIKEG